MTSITLILKKQSLVLENSEINVCYNEWQLGIFAYRFLLLIILKLKLNSDNWRFWGGLVGFGCFVCLVGFFFGGGGCLLLFFLVAYSK